MRTFFITILLSLIAIAGFSQQWNVYVFIAEECPVCNYMGKPLQEVSLKYEGAVNFYAVFPVKNSTYNSALQFKEKYNLSSFETILDRDFSTTKKLGASVTPEVVITDEFGEVRYRGRINSAYYAPGKMKHSAIKNDLDEALASLVNGKDVPQPWPAPVGCYITRNVSN